MNTLMEEQVSVGNVIGLLDECDNFRSVAARQDAKGERPGPLTRRPATIGHGTGSSPAEKAVYARAVALYNKAFNNALEFCRSNPNVTGKAGNFNSVGGRRKTRRSRK